MKSRNAQELEQLGVNLTSFDSPRNGDLNEGDERSSPPAKDGLAMEMEEWGRGDRSPRSGLGIGEGRREGRERRVRGCLLPTSRREIRHF